MEKEVLRLSETPLHREKTWECDGAEVLRVSVTLPCAEGRSRRARRFNRYYRGFARAYLAYCAAELFPRAAERYHAAAERSAPFTAASAEVTYTVTYESASLLSLYADAKEVGFSPGLTVRRADTWDCSSAFLLPPGDFFPPHTAVRRRLIRFARQEALRQTETGERVYDPDRNAALRRALRSGNFYLLPDAFCFYYQMYTVAPGAAGIITFSLPYGDNGPFLPPEP